MKMIPPLTITSAMVATNVAEPSPGEVAWSSGASYALGAQVIRVSTHRKYECISAVTGATTPEADPDHWKDIGPTNAWAMFDLERSSQTVKTDGPIVVTITPGRRINAFGLGGLTGASARAEMTVGSSPLYDKTTNLLLRNTTSWSQYYYGSFKVLEALARFDLPMSSGASLKITIQPTGGVARCGAVVIGMAEDLGTIVDEPVSDVSNFSKITRDDFGTATLVKRRNVPLNQHRVRAPATRLDRLRQLRDEMDAVPALFSGADDREASPFFQTLLVLGIARKWSIALHGPLAVISDLQIEEI